MAVISIAVAAGVGRPALYAHPEPWLELDVPIALLLDLLGGVLVAALAIAATRWLVRHTEWARELLTELHNRLSPLRTIEVAALALGSAVGEELLFRGLLEPSIGLWGSSLVFGLAHIGGGRSFRAWTVWAFVMGLILGAMFHATGTLLGPVIAHATINYVNLRSLLRTDDTRPARLRPLGARLTR